MIKLVPMTQSEFDAFLGRLIPESAEENVKAGYWSEEEAPKKSRQQTQDLLKDGHQTKDHYLFAIEAGTGDRVGMVWLRTDFKSAVPNGFIFDLFVDEAFRRKGYAHEAMLALEEKARELGLKKLGLHVFAHNVGARALYGNLGYQLGSLNMITELASSDD